MAGKEIRLNVTVLWLLAVATGLAENWILRGFGLNATQRMVAIMGFLPLMIFLVLMGVFQQLGLRRE
jgi:di/tricarboxylate transporter